MGSLTDVYVIFLLGLGVLSFVFLAISVSFVDKSQGLRDLDISQLEIGEKKGFSRFDSLKRNVYGKKVFQPNEKKLQMINDYFIDEFSKKTPILSKFRTSVNLGTFLSILLILLGLMADIFTDSLVVDGYLEKVTLLALILFIINFLLVLHGLIRTSPKSFAFLRKEGVENRKTFTTYLLLLSFNKIMFYAMFIILFYQMYLMNRPPLGF